MSYCQFIPNLFSAHACKAPVNNIICGDGVTQTVPVTASSVYSNGYRAQVACLDNSRRGNSEGETTLTDYECIVV